MKNRWALAVAIGLALAGAAAVPALLRRNAPSPAPNIDGLADSLRKTAEKKLAAPSVANEQIALTVPAEKIAARAKEIVDAAIQTGGTAIQMQDAGATLVLAKIPGTNAGFFRGLVKNESHHELEPVREDAARLIEVRLTPP